MIKINQTFYYCTLVIIATVFYQCSSDSNSPAMSVDDHDMTRPSQPAVYDSLLASELGADDYGMKRYVMAILKSGSTTRDQDSTTAANIQRAHLDNITRLVEEGKMVLAGPFSDGGEMRGIYIFDVATVEEARKLTATDPAVKAGRLVMELHPWYASATLPLIKEWHEKIQKKGI